MRVFTLFLIIIGTFIFSGCKENSTNGNSDCVDPEFFNEFTERNFGMGFTSWSFGPDQSDVNSTYSFIEDNADIYSEHLDDFIPWDALINDEPFPEELTSSIEQRLSRRISGHQLLLSVSILNSGRTDLANDVDGNPPSYSSINDAVIEDAYIDYLEYLVDEFEPEYLLIGLEVNELLINSGGKWDNFKLLMDNVRNRIKQAYPDLPVSESITLHNWFSPDVENPDTFINEIGAYVENQDFASISFYPFFKGLHIKDDFQFAFDFLHQQTSKSIAFVETAHLANDLVLESLDVVIESDECEQNAYLESLLENAQTEDYEFIIWWAHRDYDELWETFPDNQKELGSLWLDTGLLEPDGESKPAYETWKNALKK